MKIGVVGAGIAGLSAARALTTAGHGVAVFEKSRAPGGRVATREMRGIEMPRGLAGAALAFDHGAQYFTVRDDRFSEVVAEWQRDRVVAKWTGRVVTFDDEGWEDIDEGTDRYLGTPGIREICATSDDLLEETFGQNRECLQPSRD